MWNSTMQKAFNDLPATKNSVSMYPTTATIRDNQEVDYVYPVMAMEVYPGDTIELKMSGLKRIVDLKHLPYDGLKTKFHFFFVPNRLVWDNWDEFIGAIDLAREYDFDPTELVVPKITGKPALYSIYDYMGEPIREEDGGQVKKNIKMNSLPYRDINLIYNTFYRRENIQPYKVVHRGNDGEDDISDYELFKVNKDLDLFTSCLPWAQKGDPVEISIGNLAPVVKENPDEKIGVSGFLNSDDSMDELKENPIRLASFSRYDASRQERILGIGNQLVPTSGNYQQTNNLASGSGIEFYNNALAETTLQVGIGEISKDSIGDINRLSVPIEIRGSQNNINNTTMPNVSQMPSVVAGGGTSFQQGHFGTAFTWNNIRVGQDVVGATAPAMSITGNTKTKDGIQYYLQNNAEYRFNENNIIDRARGLSEEERLLSAPITTPVAFSANSFIGQITQEELDKIKVDMSKATALTVNDLRLEILKNQYKELMARAGAGRYNELVYAIWGVDMGFVRAEMPEYLGGFSLNWNFIPVVQTAPATDQQSTQLGTLASNGELKFSNKLCFRRSFTEYGFVIGLTFTKGDLSYSQGTPLKNTRTTDMDYFIPMFQEIGEQPIYEEQIYCTGEEQNDKEIFGYMPYGAKEKFIQSRDSADFRPLSDGNGGLKQNLAMKHFGEYFEDAPRLGAQFLENHTPIERICYQNANPRHIEGIIALQMKAFRQMKVVCKPGIDKI